ncbi:hypothetical protein Hanom_Chr16g01420881 [Helianthus anomalus]
MKPNTCNVITDSITSLIPYLDHSFPFCSVPLHPTNQIDPMSVYLRGLRMPNRVECYLPD